MFFCHVQKSLSHRNKYDLLGGYQYQIRNIRKQGEKQKENFFGYI